LRFISLGDVFQLLGGNNGTGVLNLISQHVGDPGVIYFQDGNPIHAVNGTLQGVDAIYPFFGWMDGRFEFNEQAVHVGRTVNNNRMQIVLDALRLLDDGMIERVGPSAFGDRAKGKPGVPADGEGDAFPVIKGPLLNYVYVIDEDHFKDGDLIVKEGGHGRWIWIILEGMVHVTKQTPQGGTLTLAQLGEGCFIGTFSSLLHTQYARSASVRASGDVQLGVLDTEILSKEFDTLSLPFRSLLVSLDGRLRKITETALQIYAKRPPRMDMKDKKVIVKKGSLDKKLFLIKKGEAYVIGQVEKKSLPLFPLEKNDVFGSLSFLDLGHEPDFASVLATEDLDFELLDPAGIQSEFNRLSETFRSFIVNVTTCIGMTTGLVSHLAGTGEGER